MLYGPMIMVNLGIFEPGEPICGWILDHWEDNLTLTKSTGINIHGFTDEKLWFSQGGMVFQPNLQNAILAYLKLREIPAALRALYNDFASCTMGGIHVLTEEYRQWGLRSGPFYKIPDESRFVHRLRDMLVLESGCELWLAVGVPRRWLAGGDGILIEQVNSHFGQVSYMMKAGKQERTIVAKVLPPIRNKPKKLWLFARIPDSKPMKSVTINNKDWKDFDTTDEKIRLPLDKGALDIVIPLTQAEQEHYQDVIGKLQEDTRIKIQTVEESITKHAQLTDFAELRELGVDETITKIAAKLAGKVTEATIDKKPLGEDFWDLLGDFVQMMLIQEAQYLMLIH